MEDVPGGADAVIDGNDDADDEEIMNGKSIAAEVSGLKNSHSKMECLSLAKMETKKQSYCLKEKSRLRSCGEAVVDPPHSGGDDLSILEPEEVLDATTQDPFAAHWFGGLAVPDAMVHDGNALFGTGFIGRRSGRGE